jgi:hypothetical protein
MGTNMGRYSDIPMPIGCLYLNNDGSRWVTQDMRFVLVMPDGSRRVRIADYFSSLGNFGTIGYRIAGKRFERMPKAHDRSDITDTTATGQNALPHIFHTAD